MSHHEVLAATHANTSVILTDHSNTERGFLPELARRLVDGVNEVLGESVDVSSSMMRVVISETDSDPLNVI